MNTEIVNSTELKILSGAADPASPLHSIINRKTTRLLRIKSLIWQPVIMFFTLMGGVSITSVHASEKEIKPFFTAPASNARRPQYLPKPIATSNDLSSESIYKMEISSDEVDRLLEEQNYTVLWGYILNRLEEFSPPDSSYVLSNRQFLLFGLNNGHLSKLFKKTIHDGNELIGSFLVVNDLSWEGIRYDEILYELLTNPNFAPQEVRNLAEIEALADFKKGLISKDKMSRTWNYLNNLSPKTLKRIGINEDFYSYQHHYLTDRSFGVHHVHERLQARRYGELWDDLIKHYEILYPFYREVLHTNSKFLAYGLKSGQLSKLFKVRFRSDDGWPSNRFVGEYLVNDNTMWQMIRSHDDILHTLLAKPNFVPGNVRELARHKAIRDRGITKATNPKAWRYLHVESKR